MADKEADPQPIGDQTPAPEVTGKKEETPDSSVITMGEHLKVKKGLTKELEETKKSHEGIVEKQNSTISELTNSKSQLEAKLANLEEASGTAQATTEELQKVKGELEETTKRADEATTKLFDMKKKKLLEVFKLPEEKLEGKTVDQLDLMDEALSAATIAGGGYAVGGGSGAGPAPEGKMDKYHAMIQTAEQRQGPVAVKDQE